MNPKNTAQTPRRVATGHPETHARIEVSLEDSPRAARRGRRSLGKGVVAGALASVLAVGSLLGYTFFGTGTGDLSADNLASGVAIPAAAADAAARSFADRSEAVSRSAVRDNLTDAVAGEAAKEREAILTDTYEHSHDTMTADQAAERDRLMAEDMKLVAAEADKRKKEAEEAAKRLEEARKAAAAAAASSGKSASSFTTEELDAVSTKGGSMPMKSNYRVGARFGATGSWSRYHTGQDFPAPVGTPVYAAASGIVMSPTSGGWAGTNVVIQHSNGGSTLYAHLSSKTVSQGDVVKAGQLIGYVGLTGRTFGAHLHFEYYKPGVTPGDVYSASDPMAFLRSLGVG